MSRVHAGHRRWDVPVVEGCSEADEKPRHDIVPTSNRDHGTAIIIFEIDRNRKREARKDKGQNSEGRTEDGRKGGQKENGRRTEGRAHVDPIAPSEPMTQPATLISSEPVRRFRWCSNSDGAIATICWKTHLNQLSGGLIVGVVVTNDHPAWTRVHSRPSQGLTN